MLSDAMDSESEVVHKVLVVVGAVMWKWVETTAQLFTTRHVDRNAGNDFP